MIDWIGLGANALWIFGLALAAATFSLTLWQSGMEKTRFRDQWAARPNQTALLAAGFFFSLGLGLAPRQLSLAAILWNLLTLAFLIQLYLLRRTPQ